MEMVKRIKIPLSEEITKRKKDIINLISELMIYTVKLYFDIIMKNDIIELSDANRFQKEMGKN